MIRVVLDTNVIVSALLQPLGPPGQVYTLALSRAIELCTSGNIHAEYEDVLRRAKFKRDEQTIAAMLATIIEKACWFRPSEPVAVCPDPDDNIFLECAQAAKADYLVTGNLKHFPEAWCGTRVVTAGG